MKYLTTSFALFLIAMIACNGPQVAERNEPILAVPATEIKEKTAEVKPSLQTIKNQDGYWIKMDTTLGVQIDIRYATENNFTHKQIYNCAACYLRPNVAEAIYEVNKHLNKKGLCLKFFDCYRPRSAQQKLWDIVPNASYVTPPTKGSMHNRGLAVDLTIAHLGGQELDMGTSYDFFGVEAHSGYANLSKEVLKNRQLLANLMLSHGFKAIRTEWWHYSKEDKQYGFSDWQWPCN